MSDRDDIANLREGVAQLLADALAVAEDTRLETARVQAVHHEELMWLGKLHDEEVEHLERALEHRDLIGQAKGITMAALHCSADEAFSLLVTQSQAQQRPLVDVASEIADRISRRAKRR